MAEKKKPAKFRVTKDYLVSLLHKGENEVLLNLPSIVPYLEDRKYTEEESESQILEIIVEIVGRVCSIRRDRLKANLSKFLRMLKSCTDFLFEDVPRLLYAVVAQEEKSINLITFMANYMTVLKTLLRHDFFPSEKIMNEIFPTLENYMNRLRERGISDLNKVEESFQYLRRQVEQLDEPADQTTDDEDFIEDFRTLSIVPRLNDIVNYEIPDIPQNIIDRPYKNVDHYLNVHYRLTREDMLRSFRECVKMSLSPNCQFLSKNNIYDKVMVSSLPKYDAEGIKYKIEITASKEIDWGKKEVLLPGGLVFLTPDDFNSVVFATIRKNPRASSNKSNVIRIIIKLEDDQYDDELYKGKIYKMIEPSAYFECYKHVLSAIKDFSENTFPLSDIITYFNFADPTPKYMDGIKKYCLHETCDVGLMELDGSCPCKVFDPLNDNEWPSSNDLKLDDMQYIAFKTALTKKVAVIQGPPGTGKTFIGVKVVKSLLRNVPHKPIVVCCLTNHALDQFLERMLGFTKKVVRLGSQSKSEVLEPNKIDNMIYAIRQYHVNKGVISDDTLKKSIDIVRKIAPGILKVQPVVEHEYLFYEICELSIAVNEYLDIFSQCENKFLDDDALNAIIDAKYKNQLRLVPGAIRKSLSAGVLEWLNCSRSTDLYVKCLKKFEQFKKQKDLNCSPDVQDVWTLTETKRYELLYCWRKKCLHICKKNYEDALETYKTYMRNFKDKAPDINKLHLVTGSDIIGVTTTGACKFREFLRLAKPCILVIEEAAQVLESHVIASLLPSIQHLILIGDHEQLRPLPADNELSERYNLKISMFERLFNNEAPSATLVMQHRMKPCIAELLVPRPYALYTSAEEVYKYEEIKGVETSVFFFDHREFEDEHSSGTSSSNDFEARMIVSFAKYLTFIQYPANEITIIATYAAQVLLILRYLEDQKLRGIKVTTVDNFQGEENDIILISFVRSNKTDVIGFLKESNRVCVALSRARKGMFCFGNFKLFADKNDLWRDIYEKLHAKNMIGDKLLLKCFRHLTAHSVESSADIFDFLSKGCSEDCNFELPCKHVCTRKCHFTDPDHLYYSCKKPCKKKIDENRVCPRLCYEKCKKAKKTYIELPCGHTSYRSDLKCKVEIPVRLPCAHEVTIPCYMDGQPYSCKAVVNITLHCGHVNSIRCFEQNLKNSIICTGLRQVVGPCGHTIDVPCSVHLTDNQISSLCNKACGSLLDCRHPCVGQCRVCFDTGIHAFCSDKCDLMLSCGHRCVGYCGSPCPPCNEKCFLKCAHTFCTNACRRQCVECLQPCERVCVHKKCTNMCWEDCNVDPCTESCQEILPCGDRCIGFCGDPCPNLCCVCDSDLVKYGNDVNERYVMLECYHVIEFNEMKELLCDCLESFEWPSCPQCTKPITQSMRFKKELKLAKKKCIDSWDTSKRVSKVQYLVETMYGVDNIVPASFQPVDDEIHNLLKTRNTESHVLMVLNNCVVLLRKLYAISSKINDSYIQEKFDTLMLWIRHHLTYASFQQLRELREAVQQLESEVSNTTRLRLGEYFISG